jgi:DNA repair protein RecO (recombination protein O)
MVVYYKEAANLNRISEIQCENQFRSVPYDHNKSAIALFLSEVLFRAIKHESHPEGVFQFIYSSILSLDHLESGYENFHLQFLLKLTRYLGFFPESGLELKSQVLSVEEEPSADIDNLLTKNYDDKIQGLSGDTRILLLDQILDFYRLHIENLGEINSYRILRDVLHN